MSSPIAWLNIVLRVFNETQELAKVILGKNQISLLDKGKSPD